MVAEEVGAVMRNSREKTAAQKAETTNGQEKELPLLLPLLIVAG